MIALAKPGLLGGTRGALWIPTVTLVAAMLGGLVDEARAAPEHVAGPFENAIAEPGQMQGLFLALQPARAGQAGLVPRAASLARPLAAEELPTPQVSARVLRSRSVAVDVAQLTSTRNAVAEARPASLRLNLFPDVGLNAVIERTAETRSGYSLSGRIQGQPHSAVTLVVGREALAGAVHSKQGTYAIVFRNGTVHSIREMEGDLQCGVDGLWPRAAVRGDPVPVAQTALSGDDGSETDVLVLFTEAALRKEGGLRQMRQSIDLAVAWTNDAYAAGGVNFRLKLVAVVQVDYRESEIHGGKGLFNQNEDLERLIAPADGFMDQAHELRNSYAADVVHLIVDQSGGGGKGSILRANAEDPSAWAFSISNSLSSYPAFLAHELGHVMGLLHDRYTQGSPSTVLPPYAYGYVNQHAFGSGAPEERRWRTIMSYDSQCRDAGFGCRQLPRFSNPNQRYPAETGDPLGVPGDEPTDATDGPADAVRSLNETRGLIAAFRQSATRCDYSLSDERREVPASGGLLSVGLDAGSNCGWTATTYEDFLSVASNATGQGSGRLSYRVEANEGPARVGYMVVGGETLPVYQSGWVAPASVCDRTPQVRDAIVSATGSSDCGAVSEFDLLDVVALDLGNQGITTLDAGDFTGLPSLVELRLGANQFGTIPKQAFRDLANLTLLSLTDLHLTSVPVAIRGLPSLQTLLLAYNDIADLHREAFSGLSELRVLRLDNNRITTLPDGIFSDLRNLRYLHLYRNRITDVRKETLRGPTDLIRLDLSWNPVGELREDAFETIPGVIQLFLRAMQLEDVSPQTFAGLTQVAWLWLGNNRIADLSGVVLPGNTLGSLRLASNELRAIPQGIFAGFTSAICQRRQMDLNLTGNPGSPFALMLELHRIHASNGTASPASVVVRVPNGAPWPITVRVAATGGSSFAREVTVANGRTESEPFQVTGDGATQLHFVSQPDVPATYQGVRIVLGDTLRLW